MSGITSNVGIFSGIDSGAIIDQLIRSSSRPKTLAQQRVVQLQSQQTSFLELNTRLGALRTAAGKFRIDRVFDAATAASSNAEALSATAATGAAEGSYQFLVDRLVTTQQVLSRGFSSATGAGLNATSFTFEPAAARLDSATRLANLNGGAGIVRGRINVRDSSGQNAVIDLSRVETIGEVVSAINAGTNGRVAARIDGDRLVVLDQGGGGGVGALSLTISDAPGSSGTAASLGLLVAATGPGDGELINGAQINRLGNGTALRTLNDGLGVVLNTTVGVSSADFRITARDGRTFDVDIGNIYENRAIPGGGTVLEKTQPAVTDLGGVIARINAATGGAVTASIGPGGVGLRLTDSTTGSTAFSVASLDSNRRTARDLGIETTATGGSGTIDGQRLIAGLNSTLARGLLGGAGAGGGSVIARARDGTDLSFNINTTGSISDLIDSFNVGGASKLTLELDATGSRFIVRDNTSGTGPLTVGGLGAAAIGLDIDEQSTSVATGLRVQRQYIGQATALSALPVGRPVGTGSFVITDSYGQRKTVTIDQNVETIGDVVSRINGSGSGAGDSAIAVRARINERGDGILIEEVARPTGPGARAISIADSTGTVARALNLVGTAAGTGAQNRIDGSFERTVNFSPTETLQQVADKINNAGVAAVASVVNDGTPGAPFRLNLTARTSGEAGRFMLDSGGLDLGLSTLAEGTNARVFFGNSDPARAILLSTTTNSVTGVVQGLTIDAKAVTENPVTVTVSRDPEAVEKAVQGFVEAFNSVVSRIDLLSKFDTTTNKRGVLLGDSLASTLRSELASTINSAPSGVTGRFQFLSQVGVSFNREGVLELNADRLRTALATDRQAVKDLFAARNQDAVTSTQPIPGVPGATVRVTSRATFSALGVGEKLASLAEKYTGSVDGVLTRRNRTLQDQIKVQNDRISTLDRQLESRRTLLQRQFLAAETAIGKLKGQQGPINSIASL
jgi:flagellar capping protein FliD